MELTKAGKVLAFTLAAGLLLSSATAFAAPTYSGTYTGKDGTTGGMTSEYQGADFYIHFHGPEPASSEMRNPHEGYLWTAGNGNEYKWDKASGKWTLISSGSDADEEDEETAEEKAAKERKRAQEAAEREAQELAYRGSLEQKRESEEEGFGSVEDMLDADSRDMSSEEWNNNAVLNTPGMDASLPVSAGQGSVVIDGEKTNITPAIEKADAAFADSINREKDGVLLNVFQVSYPSTDEAEITFDLPGLNKGNNIGAYQYVNGVWTEVEVTEVRDGHVTLHMQGDGVIAFMLKPVENLAGKPVGLPWWPDTGKEELEGSGIISSVIVVEEPPVESPVEVPEEQPDQDKKDDKGDKGDKGDKADGSEEQPVIKKIIHWNCVCGFDTTDKDAFKRHALEGARKGEQHNYHNWAEKVEVYE